MIALVVLGSFIVQIVLVLTGGPDPNTGETVATIGVPRRMVQTFSFFTIQSNLLVLVTAALLVLDPDRDGRVWRVLRLDALLGITVTGLVFDTVLIHYVHPSGWQLVATIGFHYVAPWASVLGWLLFGPWRRIDRATAVRAFGWPIAWIAYTFVHGAISGWYPYPFLNVAEIGWGRALASTGVVLGIAVLLTVLYRALDRRRGRARGVPSMK